MDIDRVDKVFVDSNIFIGVLNKRDALHEKALGVWETLKKEQCCLVVSNGIVSEVITVLSQRAGKEKALDFAYSIYFDDKHKIEMVRLDKTIELKALRHMEMTASKNMSFIDATNIAIMELHGIKRIASFDKEFRNHKSFEILS